jgi:hypothetical protein
VSKRKKIIEKEPWKQKVPEQIKNTVEIHSSRLEQVEDRISGFKVKMDIKEKTKEYLQKR